MKILNRFTNEFILETEPLRGADLSEADLAKIREQLSE